MNAAQSVKSCKTEGATSSFGLCFYSKADGETCFDGLLKYYHNNITAAQQHGA